MATRTTKTQTPKTANLNIQQIRGALPKLERRIAELESVNTSTIKKRGEPQFESIEHKIDDTLVEIFGTDTVEYYRYQIKTLDKAPRNYFEETSLADVTEGYESGVAEAITTLKTVVELFNEKLVDMESSDKAAPIHPTGETQLKKCTDNVKVFIVHGRDEQAKLSAARFIEKMGLTAIILNEQANSGKTIIEKIEENTNVGFALVLYTPCDIGGLANEGSPKPRARQNVVFEHGYLVAKLGRCNVCALVKGSIEVPSDINGIIYVALDEANAWQISVAKELRSAGYDIDMNKII
jgi:predicted nucleotide-binding protein